MLEIIQDVLSAEERAQATIDQAREASAKERSSFAEEESRLLREAQTNADQTAREEIARIRSEHEARIAAVQASLEQGAHALTETEDDRLQATVDSVIDLIVHGPTALQSVDP